MPRPLNAWCGALWLLNLCVSGCGGSGGDTGPGTQANGGQVTTAWRSYCVAKFTANDDVVDRFGDPLFTAHAGEEYLMTEYDPGVGHAGLVYLTGVGPYTFDVDTTGGTALPFTTNCASGSLKSYYAAFKDVTFYATKELSTKLCELAEGTALPRDTGTSTGFGATSSSFSGPTIYEVQLNAFSAQCGAPSGFVSVPETQVFGTTTWLVPVIAIIGPQ